MTTEEERPYKGPKSYQEDDQAIFFGRQEETNALITLIEKNRLIVLFGKTGTGKTSLVNAALFPALRKNYYLPVYIRAAFDNEASPIASVRMQLRNQLLLAVHKTPDSANDYQFQDTGESKESIYAYLSRIQFTAGVLTPVLFFDQFEELFKLGFKSMPAETLKLVNELAELINTNDTGQTTYKVVVSLREDYMAQLEDLKLQIPAIMRTRFRLKKFLGLQAFDAITKPAPHLASAETAIAIIKELGTEYDDNYYESPVPGQKWNNLVVDPIILSLYCYELNELRIERRFETIDAQLVGSSSADEIIRNYYLKAVGANLKLRTAIEEELLAEDGKTKGAAKDLDKLCLKYTLDIKEFENLDKEFRLVRIEKQNGIEKVEVTHDMIAEQIFICRQQRKEDQARKQVRNGAIIILCVLLFIGALIFGGVFYYTHTNANIKALSSQIEVKNNQIVQIKMISDSLKAQNNEYLDLMSNGGNVRESIVIRNLRASLYESNNENNSLQNSLRIYDSRIKDLIAENQNVVLIKKQADDLTIINERLKDSSYALIAEVNRCKADRDVLISRLNANKAASANNQEHFRGLDCFIQNRGVVWYDLYFETDRIEGEDKAFIKVEKYGDKSSVIKSQMMGSGDGLELSYNGFHYTFTVISIQKGCQSANTPSVHFSISRY